MSSAGVSLSTIDRLIAAGTLKRYNGKGDPKPKGERGTVFLSVAELQQHVGLKHTPDTSSDGAGTRHDVSPPNGQTHHDTSNIALDVSGNDALVALLRDQLDKAEARADTLQRQLDETHREAAAEREKFLAMMQEQTSTVRLLTDQRQHSEPDQTPEAVDIEAMRPRRKGVFGKLRDLSGF